MANEKRDQLLDSMEGKFPPAFRFETEGAMLVGNVVGFSRAYSKHGPHPVVTIKSEDDGEVYSVHCFHTALASQMQEQDPKPGDRVAVRYEGMKTAKDGETEYKNYRVRVDAPSRSFSDVMTHDEDDGMPF